MLNFKNITDKTYRNLKIVIQQNGYACIVIDTIKNNILHFYEGKLTDFEYCKNIKSLFEKSFETNDIFKKEYDLVSIYHHNFLNTFVPKSLFDENNLSSYLKYTIKISTEQIYFDLLQRQEIVNVYQNFYDCIAIFDQKFSAVEHQHFNTILVEKVLELSKNILNEQVYIHLNQEGFEIIVTKNQKLLLFNSFECSNKEDFMYYLLFVLEQMSLNPEVVQLNFLGKINHFETYFDLAFQYIRNITLLEIDENNMISNKFSDAINLEHFILFQK